MSDQDTRKLERDVQAGLVDEKAAQAARCRVGDHQQPLEFRPAAVYGSGLRLEVSGEWVWPMICAACEAQVGEIKAVPVFSQRAQEPLPPYYSQPGMVSGMPVVAIPTPGVPPIMTNEHIQAHVVVQERQLQLEQQRLEYQIRQEELAMQRQVQLEERREAQQAAFIRRQRTALAAAVQNGSRSLESLSPNERALLDDGPDL